MDARQRTQLHRSEGREIDHRNARHAAAPLDRRAAAPGTRIPPPKSHLYKGLDVEIQDTAFDPANLHLREIDTEFAREAAHRGTRMRAGESGLIDERQRPGRRRGAHGG